jgi:type IV pilus assembly protein PilA
MFKNKKGFALIELMIVIAIILILAAIAIPNYRNYQFKAKLSEGFINLSSIRTLEMAYYAEYDTFVALTASPVALGAIGSVKHQWVDNGGSATIGWSPSGDVYGSYLTQIATTSTIIGRAYMDVDGNGVQARFRIDELNPVKKTTADGIY